VLAAFVAVGLWPATGSASHTPENAWTCKGTGLRIGTSETGVSNKANNPCRTQTAFPVNLGVPLGTLGRIDALGVGSSTNANKAYGGFGDGVSTQAGVLGTIVRLGNLKVTIGAVRNIGFATCANDPNSPTGLSPKFNGPEKNQTIDVSINDGKPIKVEGPVTLPLGVLTLKLNQTTKRRDASGGKMVQRAVEINSPLLPTIVIAESIVDYTGNPCDRVRPAA
jgi:hypothetical protein